MAQPSPLSNEQLQAVLAEVWEKSVPVLRERVDVLQRAVNALADGTLTDRLRGQAGDEAHRLAGLLGTFGYPEGTEAARTLELVFDPQPDQRATANTQDSSDTKPDPAQMQACVALLSKIVGT